MRANKIVTKLPNGQETSVELSVVKDYDGYFEKLVRQWASQKKEPFHHKKIVITSGPWRMSAVETLSEDGYLNMDFYSPLSKGFGSLSEKEVNELIEML